MMERNRIARLLCLALCWLVLAGAAPARAEEPLALASQAAVLLDADTGTVLYEKNMHQALYPASITKLMTALLAEQVLTVSQTAVNAVPRSSSHISLLPGEQLTAEQALYAIGMESANDAANVLAEAVAGSLAAFAEQMTEAAQALGATDTHFSNANGLPDSTHTTTAYDMALITAAAWKQEGLARYFNTVSYTLPATNLSAARSFQNKDRLLAGGQYYYEGVQMAKTGWTSSAQGTFAAVVQRDGVTLVAVTMKSPLLEDKYKDTLKLLDYGFSHYSRVTVSGELIAAGQDLEDFTPRAGQQFSYLIPADMSMEDIRYTVTLPENADARALRRTAAVTATLHELRLPDAELELERPPKPREAFTLAELLQNPSVTLEGVPRAARIVIAAAALALIVLILLWLHRQLKRHRRRRHLKAKIRRMKKKMEP